MHANNTSLIRKYKNISCHWCNIMITLWLNGQSNRKIMMFVASTDKADSNYFLRIFWRGKTHLKHENFFLIFFNFVRMWAWVGKMSWFSLFKFSSFKILGSQDKTNYSLELLSQEETQHDGWFSPSPSNNFLWLQTKQRIPSHPIHEQIWISFYLVNL